ncbi:MAG: carbon-nitrogen hydrolase family protein [Candidatus Merdivicinus sp.]|jgi:predicted amidohydrolase
MSDQKICIGLLKHIPRYYDVKQNLDDFEGFAAEAARRGVQLLVTCESYLDGYCVALPECTKEKLEACAQDLHTSPLLNRVREIAAKFRMHIIFGFTMKTESGIRNSVLFVDADGKDIGVYSKTHLMTHDLVYERGDDLPVFETALGKIGIMICADRRFPETARTLKLRGAELIVNPTYGMWHLANEWWMRTKAYENECYIAFSHPQVSFVCDPHGEIEAKLMSSRSDILVHDIDLSVQVQEMLPYRRADLYEKN